MNDKYFKGKYKSFKALAMAFTSGEVSKDWFLSVDNDHAFLSYRGEWANGQYEDEDDEEKRYEEGVALFYYDAPIDPIELLIQMSIPSESV